MRRVFVWTALAVYCSVITALSAMSHPPVGAPSFRFGDKLAHLAAYAILGTLAALAASHTFSRWTSRSIGLFAWVFGTAFGIADEFHQRMVPGRSFELLDMVADSFGAGLAALLYVVAISRRAEQARARVRSAS